MTELRQLTGARGIAAWMVVLYHIRDSIAGLPAPLLGVLAKGYLAVDFFFVLSGFVIWLAWHDRAARTPLRFWQKRVARIWPLHLAMLGLAAAFALAATLHGRPAANMPWGALPLHVMLVQSWGFVSPLNWNDPAWSISAELAAYLLFPLLVRFVDWRRWPTAALPMVAAIMLLVLPLAMGFGGLGDIDGLGLLRCLCEFGAGTVMAALFVHGGRLWLPLMTGVALVAAYLMGVPETVAVPGAFAALLLALARSHAQPLAVGPIHWLGEISYATYLAHFLLWRFYKLPLGPGAYGAAVIVGYLALVLVASHLLYRWLERPAQRWINALPLARNERHARALPGDGSEDRLFR